MKKEPVINLLIRIDKLNKKSNKEFQNYIIGNELYNVNQYKKTLSLF